MPDAGGHAVLIEAGGQADRIGKAAAKQALLQAQIAPLQLGPQAGQTAGHEGPMAPQGGLAQGRQGQLAELFGIGAVIAAE